MEKEKYEELEIEVIEFEETDIITASAGDTGMPWIENGVNDPYYQP